MNNGFASKGAPLRSLRVYPEGLVTSGIISKFNPPSLVKTTPEQREHDRWIHASIENHGYQATVEAVETLGLSIVTNFPKKVRTPRGLKGITRHGARLVRFAAEEMARLHGQKHLSFLTCTLPNLEECLHEYLLLLQNWDRLLKNFIQKVQYHLAKAGLPISIVGCTEVQEKRILNHGCLPLHIHWIFVGRHPHKAWEFTPQHISEWWRECIEKIIGINPDITYNASTRIERIHKSASGYIGKYMSKGTQVIKKVNEQGYEWLLPSTWYTCTNDLRTIYKKNLYVTTGLAATRIHDLARGELSYLFACQGTVTISLPNGLDMEVGWWGRLKRGVSPKQFLYLVESCESIHNSRVA